jgi:hypothetical protein
MQLFSSAARVASQALPGRFARPLRHTSRRPERGERDTGALCFLKREAMQHMVDEGAFAETREEGLALTGTTHAAIAQVHLAGRAAYTCVRAPCCTCAGIMWQSLVFNTTVNGQVSTCLQVAATGQNVHLGD